jgi:hypothetical protein
MLTHTRTTTSDSETLLQTNLLAYARLICAPVVKKKNIASNGIYMEGNTTTTRSQFFPVCQNPQENRVKQKIYYAIITTGKCRQG